MSALLWWCDFTYTICRVTLPTERVSWNFWTYIITSYDIVTLPTERVSWNFTFTLVFAVFCKSRSPRSVWVEIFNVSVSICSNLSVTLPTERVSWNYTKIGFIFANGLSRSPRSVWVEIFEPYMKSYIKYVTLPTERVSWNDSEIIKRGSILVTLPTERVSWNFKLLFCYAVSGKSRSPRSVWVEIIFSSIGNKIVPRHAPHGACELKFVTYLLRKSYKLSRSPRSVWVEMKNRHTEIISKEVTLPTERVSWNTDQFVGGKTWRWSRSPRSVWVEISKSATICGGTLVTLPTERVSWNFSIAISEKYDFSHAPHGACELKLLYVL